MKKFFLLLLISISFIACQRPEDTITTGAFIDDLNSFDSTATYNAITSHVNYFTFVVSCNDSLFYYNTERSDAVVAIYIYKNPGDKVK